MELRPPSYFALAALIDGPLHGYAIMRRAGELSGGTVRLSTGTLYALLERALAEGLVSAGEPYSQGGRTRRDYALTGDGREALAAAGRSASPDAARDRPRACGSRRARHDPRAPRQRSRLRALAARGRAARDARCRDGRHAARGERLAGALRPRARRARVAGPRRPGRRRRAIAARACCSTACASPAASTSCSLLAARRRMSCAFAPRLAASTARWRCSRRPARSRSPDATAGRASASLAIALWRVPSRPRSRASAGSWLAFRIALRPS